MKPLAASLVLLLAACSAPIAEQASAPVPVKAPAPSTAAVAGNQGDPVEGRKVATRVGCFGCHGKQLEGSELWGEQGSFQIRSANVTEKRRLYDDAAFERLLRTGRTHDGHRPLGMPITMYQYLSDREVRDITAMVRSVPDVPNPGLEPSWHSDAARKEQEGWGDDIGDPGKAGAPAEPPAGGLAKGRHLVMTSCPECHAPDLNGYPDDDAPSLIVAKGYSAEQFRTLMRTGLTAQGTQSKTGLMSEVARDRFATTLSDADIDSMKAFLDGR